MVDMDTVGNIILAGAIVQIILSILLINVGSIAVSVIVRMIMWGIPLIYYGIPSIHLVIAPALIMGIIGLICAIFWFRWRYEPSEYKTALIVTGIVCIFSGVAAGIIVLIAGIMASVTTDYEGA